MISKKILNPAELIVENDRIYHLGLRPEDISDIIICVGDPDRVHTISQYFDSIEVKIQHREFVTHTGYFNKCRVSVISTGIGVDNMEIVMNELDALANIDLKQRKIKSTHKALNIIRLGTSGVLHEEIPLNSLIISSYAIGLDSLLEFYSFEFSKEEIQGCEQLMNHLGIVGKILRPYFVKACPRLLQHLHAGCHEGITVTAPGFFAPQGRFLRGKPAIADLLELFRSFSFSGKKTLNLEMETSILYAFGNMLGHNCIAITVALTNRMTGEMTHDLEKAAQNLIETMLPRITSLS